MKILRILVNLSLLIVLLAMVRSFAVKKGEKGEDGKKVEEAASPDKYRDSATKGREEVTDVEEVKPLPSADKYWDSATDGGSPSSGDFGDQREGGLSKGPQACLNKNFELEDYIASVAAQIEDQEIMYNSKRLSDCSGIFLRVMESLQNVCPAYAYPPASKVRSSRDIARWFYDNSKLVILKKATEASSHIRPGAVLFFGHRNKKYTAPTIQQLTEAGKGIEHVGIVTAVEKDAANRVIRYTLFHGRSAGKPASRTYNHYLKPGKERPVYGNGTQPLVAVANGLTKASS